MIMSRHLPNDGFRQNSYSGPPPYSSPHYSPEPPFYSSTPASTPAGTSYAEEISPITTRPTAAYSYPSPAQSSYNGSPTFQESPTLYTPDTSSNRRHSHCSDELALQAEKDTFPSGTHTIVDSRPVIGRRECEIIVQQYLLSLSPRKRDKALISQKKYNDIVKVLENPVATTVDTAQFRHWAKNRFDLGRMSGHEYVIHDNKPVAIREALPTILLNAHRRSGHGGRDKTSTEVRKVFSWVPKELIARFVKGCPTCKQRREAPPRGGTCSASALSGDSREAPGSRPVYRVVGRGYGSSATAGDEPNLYNNANGTSSMYMYTTSTAVPVTTSLASPLTSSGYNSEPWNSSYSNRAPRASDHYQTYGISTPY